MGKENREKLGPLKPRQTWDSTRFQSSSLASEFPHSSCVPSFEFPWRKKKQTTFGFGVEGLGVRGYGCWFRFMGWVFRVFCSGLGFIGECSGLGFIGECSGLGFIGECSGLGIIGECAKADDFACIASLVSVRYALSFLVTL